MAERVRRLGTRQKPIPLRVVVRELYACVVGVVEALVDLNRVRDPRMVLERGCHRLLHVALEYVRQRPQPPIDVVQDTTILLS